MRFTGRTMWRIRVAAVCLAVAGGMFFLSFFVLGDSRGWNLVGAAPAVVALILGSTPQRMISLGMLAFAVLSFFC